MGWLPTKRPPGSGEIARLWDLGGTLGKSVVLASVTFIAYLIGSFVEIGPSGKIARLLVPLVMFEREPRYSIELPIYAAIRQGGSPDGFSPARRVMKPDPRTNPAANNVAQSLSREARSDLVQLLQQRGKVPTVKQTQEDIRHDADANEYLSLMVERELVADDSIDAVIKEMPQLASRLLVKNKDLYGKYDRLMSEAALRINLSIPLALLLTMVIWLSSLAMWLKLCLTLLAIAFGFLLLRQGFLRTVSARDVIAQALTIDEIQSRHMLAAGSAVAHAERPAKSIKESDGNGLGAPAEASSEDGS